MPYPFSSLKERHDAIAAAEDANKTEIVIEPGTTIYVKGETRPYLILARVRAVEEVEKPEPRGCRDWG